MTLKFKGDIVRTEKYNDKKTGEEKKKHTNVGSLFEREDGSLCINFLGTWLNIYPPKAKKEDFKKLKEDLSATDKVYAPQEEDEADEIQF